MKLRATISIEIDAPDFVAAANHQQRIEHLVSAIREQYPSADLELRERRAIAKPRGAASPPKVVRFTGKLNRYEDFASESAAS